MKIYQVKCDDEIVAVYADYWVINDMWIDFMLCDEGNPDRIGSRFSIDHTTYFIEMENTGG